MGNRGLLAMMGGGVGVVALMAVFMGPGGEQAARRGAAATTGSSQAALGVRAGDVDSARRSSGSAEAPAFVMPEPRPEGEAPTGERRGGEPVPESVPVPLGAGAVAEAEAVLAVQPKVLAAVEEALATRRSQLRRSCWNGDVPASASFPVEASYGADGTMLSLSVSDDRGAPNVGACVRGQGALVPPTIEAPGVGVTVRTALTLP